ncbi:hypothetical protein K443DRAFT_408309 [Laccaria amethystina LaAM-08-1]|uniref:Uncharacterized protein n=1 Tax=Laccaria amethystina LaAM-08-1 TaxID=1095629 RepID=A0A0C9XA80_9AGAR|nr:hypothetical protein K443DRAFT_408309 [Laccaria amethystina LaAM-08-1]
MPLKSLADANRAVHKSYLCDANACAARQRFNHRSRAESTTGGCFMKVALRIVPYHPLRLDSRTPGICFGPYDDVLRTTCASNELLMRCREGSYAREGSWPVLYSRGQLTSP